MRSQLISTAAAGVLIAVASARAQTLPQVNSPQSLAERYVDPSAGLSIDDAVKRALEREPSLRSARTQVDAARAMRLQAGLRPNPSASFEWREEPGGTDNQTTIGMEWPLDLFRRSARLTVADREIEATEQSVADRARLLAAEVRMQYGEAAAAVRDVAVADNLAVSARRELELLRARVEEGASPPLERDLLDVELRRLESDRLIAAGRADAALFALKRLMGEPAEGPVKLRDTLETLVRREPDAAGPAPPPPLDAAVVGGRSDVREAAARVRLADARVNRARSEGRFDVSLFGTYMRMDAGFPQRGFDHDGSLERVRGVFNYVAGGVMVMVPLSNRNQGEIAAAQADRAGAEATLEASRLTAQSEIAAAAARDVQAQQAVVLYEGGIQLARQNLDVIRQTYELGRGRISDVLIEQRRYLDLEHAFTATLREAFDARTALRRARGEL
jgi:cobalt-zinc-cadmium efflux system outer membrane protein